MRALYQPKPLVGSPVNGPGTRELPPIGRPVRHWPWRVLAQGAALACVLGLVVAGVFTWWDRTTVHRGGPATIGGEITGQRLGVGKRTAFGTFLLLNGAKTPAVLEDVRILGVTGGLEVLDVRTSPVPLPPGASDGTSLAIDDASSPLAERHVVPVAKSAPTTDGTDQGLRLVVAARAGVPGVARARGVEITYRVGPRRYRRSYEGGMYLCAPIEAFTAETCPGRAEDRFDAVVADFPVNR